LCARLWLELDIIPIVLRKAEENVSWGSYDENLPFKSLDEQAESMARKCIRQVFTSFGFWNRKLLFSPVVDSLAPTKPRSQRSATKGLLKLTLRSMLN
jgi:hypothetical protein